MLTRNSVIFFDDYRLNVIWAGKNDESTFQEGGHGKSHLRYFHVQPAENLAPSTYNSVTLGSELRWGLPLVTGI